MAVGGGVAGLLIVVSPGRWGSVGTVSAARWMRTRLPAGSRNAQSRTPYGWSVGSWTTSAPLACSCSNGASRSAVARMMLRVGALGHHLGDGAALVVGDAGVGGRRVQHDRGAGLARRADGDPAHAARSRRRCGPRSRGCRGRSASEASGSSCGRKAGVDGDVHGGHARRGAGAGASRFLTGRVTCLATHDGMPGRRRAGGLAPVGARRHPDQLGEAGAEGAQRRAADREADLGDAQVAAAQQRHRPLDAARHQVAVRRLAVGRA